MIKIKPKDTLKHYVSYFQSQIDLIYNCNVDVAAATFVSGLQVTHFFYKHLVKHEVIKMRGISLGPRSTLDRGCHPEHS